jgi:hypothetical protein
MAEYIKREDAVAKFQKLKDKCESLKDAIYLDGVTAVLDAIPAADVAEVGHGKWVKIAGMAPPESHGLHCCSLCGGLALQRNLKEELSDFCPHCGADMREVAHESPQI